jgi:SpoVK/Ycf46/Vps4 family AAA+-type ATPase
MQTEQDFPARLGLALRARVTLLVIVSPEEERVISVAKGVCDGWNPPRPCIAWDNVEGFSLIAGKTCPVASPRDPLSALEEIAKADENAVFLLPDFHEYWNNPQVKRKLKNLSRKFRYDRRTIIIITSTYRIPDEIRNDAVIIRLPPPSFAELSHELDELVATTGIPETLTPSGREKLVQAALGMTLSQARRSFSKAIVQSRSLCDRDIDRVIEDKQEVISQSDALEFSRSRESACNVGGLAVLKEWLALRERAFTREAREYGLAAPKGIALIGIPGTGKSLAAKMIADTWHLPLVRLDVGALFGSLVGESEERTRRALSLAEAIAPCILWVDEIEKAFAFGSGDAGTSQRVFAHLLT